MRKHDFSVKPRILVADETRDLADVSDIPKAVLLEEWLRRYAPGEITYAQMPFDHPAYILFSSGTTGAPKCIVHSVGGALLKHLTEQKLHPDIKPGDRLVGALVIGRTDHIGAIRGLIQCRTPLGRWKTKLMRDPTRVAEAFVSHLS